MLVAGWADGYRNATFRVLERLRAPCRLLLGPWSHMATDSSLPGPRIDLVPELEPLVAAPHPPPARLNSRLTGGSGSAHDRCMRRRAMLATVAALLAAALAAGPTGSGKVTAP
jgi:hypothetical protein